MILWLAAWWWHAPDLPLLLSVDSVGASLVCCSVVTWHRQLQHCHLCLAYALMTNDDEKLLICQHYYSWWEVALLAWLRQLQHYHLCLTYARLTNDDKNLLICHHYSCWERQLKHWHCLAYDELYVSLLPWQQYQMPTMLTLKCIKIKTKVVHLMPRAKLARSLSLTSSYNWIAKAILDKVIYLNAFCCGKKSLGET